MIYFSITATGTQKNGRTCAVFPARSPEDAIQTGSQLQQSGLLSFVDTRDKLTVRRASRREVDLLQRFLFACGGADLTTLRDGEIDNLLARRQSLMLSFFMGLYLDPGAIASWIDKRPVEGSDEPKPGSGSGSGGIVQSAEGLDADDSSLQGEDNGLPETIPADPAPEQDATTEAEDGDGLVTEGDAPIDEGDMLAVLADLASAGPVADGPADLGDDDPLEF